MAKSGDYKKIYINRGYNNVEGVKVFPNNRPDILGIRITDQVNVVEVLSKTDSFDILMQRNIDVMNQLPSYMKGDIKVIPPQ